MTATGVKVTNHPAAKGIEHTAVQALKVNVGDRERVASVVGGGALALYGLDRGGIGGLALALLGGALVTRGVTGHCEVYSTLGVNRSDEAKRTVEIARAVTINRPAEELYQFWRNFEQLPRFKYDLKSVHVTDDRHLHWVARGPLDSSVEWDAEITEDRPNELIAWRSLPGADVDNNVEVRFRPAPGGRGTEVHVRLRYDPPGGKLGVAVAKVLGENPEFQVGDDLRRFKELMETGEISTIEGQPSGRKRDQHPAITPQPQKPDQRAADRVHEASAESFPASDPPGWTDREREATS